MFHPQQDIPCGEAWPARCISDPRVRAICRTRSGTSSASTNDRGRSASSAGPVAGGYVGVAIKLSILPGMPLASREARRFVRRR